jgi:hypothetical protein
MHHVSTSVQDVLPFTAPLYAAMQMALIPAF